MTRSHGGSDVWIAQVPTDADAAMRQEQAKPLACGPEELRRAAEARPRGKATAVPLYIYDPSSTSVTTKIGLLNTIIDATSKLTGIPPRFSLSPCRSSRRYRFIDSSSPASLRGDHDLVLVRAPQHE
jgi:hypothetical protein